MVQHDPSRWTAPSLSLTLALVLALVLPTGAAAAGDQAPARSLDGPLTGDELADPCTNYGVIVVVSVTGTATYCKGRANCENYGYIVAAGTDARACGYRGVLVICSGERCDTVGGYPGAETTSGPAVGLQTPCGAAQDPVCWASAFLCPYWGPAVEDAWDQVLGPYLEAYLKTCTCHPGDPRCEPETAAIRR